jgi:hypothetical protein
MKNKYLILVSFASILIMSCCSTRNLTEEYPYGYYSYEEHNKLGILVSEGSLYLHKADSNTVQGNYAITVSDRVDAGLNSGFLIGRIENDSIFIDLDPDYTKTDWTLAGTLDSNVISGDWEWRRNSAAFHKGSFIAIRK